MAFSFTLNAGKVWAVLQSLGSELQVVAPLYAKLYASLAACCMQSTSGRWLRPYRHMVLAFDNFAIQDCFEIFIVMYDFPPILVSLNLKLRLSVLPKYRLESLPKTTVRDPHRANGCTLAHCPSISEWGSYRDTGEIKVAMKGTGHPTSRSSWPRTSVLSNRHFPNVRIVRGTYP